jgi:tRNA(Ile)-lysidine synthase
VTEARVAVAYSGGRDSTALLHATLRAAGSLGIAVVALHVHHGLMPNADAWLLHCRRRCMRWTRAGHRLEFVSRRLTGSPPKGESVEAWAREGRYAALGEMAVECGTDLVLLAHHQQDQAETFLLQALRGGGMAGLAGMPRVIERQGVTWARPWLAQPREAIDAYMRRHRLGHVDDDSNDDERLARSRLRRVVLPTLTRAFPQAEQAMATAAGWANEAAVCLGELAEHDLATLANDLQLQIAPWSALSVERRSNALRHWLQQVAPGSVSAALTKRLLVEITACAHGRWLIAGGELHSHRGLLSFRPSATPTHDRHASFESTLQVSGEGAYPLPGWGGILRATSARQSGIGLAALRRIDLLPRSGAEQFQMGPGRPPRALKKQYQAAGVRADRRGGPLLYSEGRLLFVPGLGIDARAMAAPGDAQMTLEWSWPSTADGGLSAVGRGHLHR